MKLSLNDLIFLMDLIGGRPYQTEKSDLFKRLKKEKEEINFYGIAKAISEVKNLPVVKSNKLARLIVSMITYRIADALIENDDQFNEKLFFHSCR